MNTTPDSMFKDFNHRITIYIDILAENGLSAGF